MVAGGGARLKFDDPEHRAIFDRGPDLARAPIGAIFYKMDREIIGRPDELSRHLGPPTPNVSANIINPDDGLAAFVVTCHHPADVDRHCFSPSMLRQRPLRNPPATFASTVRQLPASRS